MDERKHVTNRLNQSGQMPPSGSDVDERLSSLQDLRAEILTTPMETAEAVRLSQTAVLRNTITDLKLKKVLVRSTILFLLLLLVSQLAFARYQYQTAQEDGPVPITLAVDQLGADLPIAPSAPPLPR